MTIEHIRALVRFTNQSPPRQMADYGPDDPDLPELQEAVAAMRVEQDALSRGQKLTIEADSEEEVLELLDVLPRRPRERDPTP